MKYYIFNKRTQKYWSLTRGTGGHFVTKDKEKASLYSEVMVKCVLADTINLISIPEEQKIPSKIPPKMLTKFDILDI